MNRQQKRAKERETKKQFREVPGVMTPLGAYENFVGNLSDSDAKIIHKAVMSLTETAYNEEIAKFNEAIDRCFSATLINETDLEYDTIYKLFWDMLDNLKEDTEVVSKFKEKYGDEYMTKVNGFSKEVQDRIVGLLEKGVNKRDSILELEMAFPTLSKSMLSNAWAKTRKEWLIEQRATQEILDVIENNNEEKVEDPTPGEIVATVEESENKAAEEIVEVDNSMANVIASIDFQLNCFKQERHDVVLQVKELEDKLIELKTVYEKIEEKESKMLQARALLKEV